MTKLPTITKVFLALIILCLTSGVLPGQPKEAPKTITVPAQVQAGETAEIYSLVTGHLAKQTADIGQRVQKGQVLAELDAPLLIREFHQARDVLKLVVEQLKVVEAQVAAGDASVKEARSRIEQTEADLLAASLNLKNHVRQFDRMKALAARNVVSSEEIDGQSAKVSAAEAVVRAAQAVVHQAKDNLEVKLALVNKARAEVDVHRARIRVQESALELAKTRLGFTKIVAPFDGVITRRQFSTGELIRAGDHGRPLPLFVVQRIDRMRVVFQVPEKSAPLVQVGMKVELTIPSGDGPIQGTITRTAFAIEEGSMRAEMDVPNTGNLRPGMAGKAIIHLEKAK